jgi:hypothetical protein
LLFFTLVPEARSPCLDPIGLALFWLLPPRGRCDRSLVQTVPSTARSEAELAALECCSSSNFFFKHKRVLSLPTFFILHHDSALLPFGISSVTCLSTIHFVGHSRKPIYLTFETGLRLSDTDNTPALEASI